MSGLKIFQSGEERPQPEQGKTGFSSAFEYRASLPPHRYHAEVFFHSVVGTDGQWLYINPITFRDWPDEREYSVETAALDLGADERRWPSGHVVPWRVAYESVITRMIETGELLSPSYYEDQKNLTIAPP